ncbi:MAG TPA: FtsX-like permease family protein [Vicinamibacterales bacterium]|nr:FtsX-like permease family protein [Vicinamibacterales bacterium]
MSFVIRMAWRETRASWARLLFFFACVALGVAAIVVLRSVVTHVRTTLTREARHLVGADIVIQAQRPWTDELRARIDQMLQHEPVRDRQELVDTQTMAVPMDGQGGGVVRLVEVRGIEAAYPFYGAPELEGGVAYSHALVEQHGVLVQPEFLIELGLKVGDRVKLAGEPFTIRGVVTKDRVQRGGGIAFGPRVYVDLADLKQTALLGFGSRATYQLLLRVDEPAIVSLTDRLRREFRKDAVGVRSWRSLEDRLGENLTTAENYLSLVGFAIVVLGGIGVWSVTRVVVLQKMRSVAVLKCLGATSGRVLATYVLQVLWLAGGGSALGVGLGALAIAAIPARVLTPLGVEHVGVTASAVGQGVGVGVLVSLLFALVPLLEVRQVKPLLLLRADTATTARRRDWRSVLAGTAVILALALVAVWQANSWRAGLFVSGGLAVVGASLLGVNRVILSVVGRFARSSRFAVRHAVLSLGRPGSQARVILMAVGLGCFFILAVRAIQSNLLDDFRLEVGRNSPDFVLIDIQRDQVDGVRAAVAPYAAAPPRLLPLMRARVVGVDGRQVSLPTAEDVRRQGELTREYGITFRDALQDNEKLVDGAFWPGPLADAKTPDGLDTEVSIEQMVREQAHVGVGDIMRFDIAGRVIQARVTSIRKVTWDEAQNGGFVFIFRPGPAMERTPHTYVGFLQVVADPSARGAVQRDLALAFPNVSSIDVRDVLASIKEVLDNVTLGVTIVGAVTLAGGVLILVGAVAMTKFQRLYEAAIYRTLGASTRMIASMVAIEYALLGALAGLVGAAGALALSWALARWLFDIEWRPAGWLFASGVVATAVTVAAVGLAASADILVRKPLAVLRSE